MDALRDLNICADSSISNRMMVSLVVVEANERSQVWNLQAIRECMSGLQLTLHQMCNYETLKRADDIPCCSRLKILTNFPIDDKRCLFVWKHCNTHASKRVWENVNMLDLLSAMQTTDE